MAGKSNWLKMTCLGCVGLFVLMLVVVGVFVAIGASQARSGEDVADSFAPDLPPISLPESGEGDGDGAEQIPLDALPPTEEAIIVDLDVVGATLELEAVAPDEPLEINAEYAEKYAEFERSVETTKDGLIVSASLNRKGSFAVDMLRQAFGGTSPTLVARIPEGRPIRLRVRVKDGASEVDLAGLMLVEVELDMSRAGGAVEFGGVEPGVMERLDARLSMGGFALQGVGDASPKQADFDVSMGGGALILEGDWLNDSDVSIRLRSGGVSVILPDDVVLEGIDRVQGISPADAASMEIPPPTLRFKIDADDPNNLEFAVR